MHFCFSAISPSPWSNQDTALIYSKVNTSPWIHAQPFNEHPLRVKGGLERNHTKLNSSVLHLKRGVLKIKPTPIIYLFIPIIHFLEGILSRASGFRESSARGGVISSLETGSLLGGRWAVSWSLKTEWDVFREVVTQTLIPGLEASAIPGNLLKTQRLRCPNQMHWIGNSGVELSKLFFVCLSVCF